MHHKFPWHRIVQHTDRMGTALPQKVKKEKAAHASHSRAKTDLLTPKEQRTLRYYRKYYALLHCAFLIGFDVALAICFLTLCKSCFSPSLPQIRQKTLHDRQSH